MTRRLIAVLIVVGLGIGVWVLWPRDDSGPSTTTSPIAAVTTTDGPPAQPTTTPAPGDSTTAPTGDGTHVVETVEEAEEILRDLWFGWFEGIYNQDEERIREVVASQQQLDSARAQFGRMEFVDSPTREALRFTDVEILRSDRMCLAVWAQAAATFRPGSSEGVNVIRRVDDTWLLVGTWAFRDDLWENECDALLEPLS